MEHDLLISSTIKRKLIIIKAEIVVILFAFSFVTNIEIASAVGVPTAAEVADTYLEILTGGPWCTLIENPTIAHACGLPAPGEPTMIYPGPQPGVGNYVFCMNALRCCTIEMAAGGGLSWAATWMSGCGAAPVLTEAPE